MSLSALGRRFERLLFFAAPLSFASLLTLFVVFASETQKERITARCYEQAARLLESKSAIAEALWDGFVKRKKDRVAEIDYVYGLRRLLIDTSLATECYQPLLGEVEARSKQGPASLINSLRVDSKKLLTTPIRYSGVELPEKATVGVLGTTASVELTLFSNLLQVVLAPLLLLWLGSLYNTRYRETLLIAKAKGITEAFPHLINVYPAVRYPEPRRRSLIKPHLHHLFSFLYAAVRIGLMLMFVMPAVGAYVIGVVLLHDSAYFAGLVVLAVLVGIFAFAVVLCELLPWHYGKTFPGLPLLPDGRQA